MEPGVQRRFCLHREKDLSGISGTGIVAEGVEFTDGTVVIRWVAGDHRSTVVWDDIESVVFIHGHGGATQIVWID
jgi:hypothetical protein